MKKTILLAIVLSFVCFLTALHSDEKPTCTVKRTTGRIYVDGNITEEDWKAAQPVGDFVFPWYKEGKKEQTDARLSWDDEFLYILFRCEDEHISAHNFSRSSSPWVDDCVEAFIASNPEQPLWYANYEINCLCTWILGEHKEKSGGRQYPDKILTGRSHMGTINKEDDTDEYWIMEIGIPFDSMSQYETQLPPKPGDVWHFNLNRCGGDVNPQYSLDRFLNTGATIPPAAGFRKTYLFRR